MDDHQNEVADEVGWGSSRGQVPWPAWFGRNKALTVTMIIIAGLVAAVIVLSVDRVSGTSPVRPALPKFLDGNALALRLTRASGGDLDVAYVQEADGSEYAWVTVAATGLPQGFDYLLTVGDCHKNRARALSGVSGLPNSATNVLLLSAGPIRASENAVLWVTITDPSGTLLGGIRGPFLAPLPGVTIVPGEPVCPSMSRS